MRQEVVSKRSEQPRKGARVHADQQAAATNTILRPMQ